jgi:hypothetical protein
MMHTAYCAMTRNFPFHPLKYIIKIFKTNSCQKDKYFAKKILQQIGSASLLAAAGPLTSFAAKKKRKSDHPYSRKISSNDKVRLAVILWHPGAL